MADQNSPLADLLTAAFRRRFGDAVAVGSLKPLTGGASAETWKIELVAEDTPPRWYILQREAGDERFFGSIPRGDQAKLQIAAAAAGVPVARVAFILTAEDAIGDGYVMDCLDGETLAPRILRQERFAGARAVMAAQCGEILAKIHQIPLDAVDFVPTSDAAAQLADYRASYHEAGVRLPVFDLAFQWLADHLPPSRQRTLVHGDFRHGNFMVDESGIVGVLDWELSHIGDPVEDLTFLSVPSWRFGQIDRPVGGFGSRDDLFAAYTAAGGLMPTADELLFWELFGSLKWGVVCLFFATRHLNGIVRSVERAAIGRRISETELDILMYLRKGRVW